MTLYIYTLTNPNNNQVFYVGATGYPVSRKHGHNSKINTEKKLTAKDQYILSNNIKPVFEIIDETEGWHIGCALELEAYWICQLRSWGFELTNTYKAYKRN
jgi:hypothetical protein